VAPRRHDETHESDVGREELGGRAVDSRVPVAVARHARDEEAARGAFHDDTRLVLAPVELKLEPIAGQPGGRGVLRLVLLDARLSNVRWIGEIASDPSPTLGPAIVANVAAKLAAAVAP